MINAWRYKHWGARHTTAWGKNNVNSSFYSNKRSSSSFPGPLLAGWPANTCLGSKRDQNLERASHHLSVQHKPPLKQTIQESQLAPLLLFFKEDNQGHLLKSLAVRMIILRTKMAALPYLMHLSAVVAERIPWMGRDYPERSVAEPPYSPGSPVLLPHMHKPDVTSEKRPLWQSVFQLPEIRAHISVFLAWVSLTDFLTDLPCLCSVLVSLKFTL